MSLIVSVVVPTYKRPALLQSCLRSLLEQDLPVDQYEILVVDDAAEQSTRLLLQSMAVTGRPMPAWSRDSGEMQACPALRYVPANETQGPAAARNLGWRSARGEIIAFTDDDCLPEPNWLREGVRAIQGGLDGAGGQVIVPLSSHPTDFEKNTAGLMVSEFVTANCFYRRAVLDALGGFDEQFKLAWREDADLYFRMMENSYQVAQVPRARVVHPVRQAPWGISLQEQRKSMYNALLYKKHPQLYRQHIQALPPMHYYAMLGSVFLAAILFLRGSHVMGFLMVAVWAGLTSRFASKRLKGASHAPAHVLEMAVTSILIPILSVFWRLYGAFYFRVFFL